MSDTLYTAKALSTGGGRDGHVATDDRKLDLETRPPKEMGGSGEGTNPEQLASAAWASCFNGALQLMLKQGGVKVEQTPEVEVTMSLNKGDDGLFLSATISATVFGVDQATADEYVQQAHQFCPYSKAFRNNVEVEVTATAG